MFGKEVLHCINLNYTSKTVAIIQTGIDHVGRFQSVQTVAMKQRNAFVEF
jgi:hypothetical protein